LILERVDDWQLLLQGFAKCKITSPESTLERVRSVIPSTQVQLLRADRIGGKEHIISAARNAVRAFTQGHQRAHSLAIEFLLYTSCQRQISRGIQIIGITKETKDIVLAVLTNDSIDSAVLESVADVLRGSLDDAVLEVSTKGKSSQLLKTYNVTKIELESSRLPNEDERSVLKRLIIERSAILSLEK
jgi:tRNA threonylcarbamoyladenosine modification (KEOPS) complex Cgi121 subunit